MVFAEYISLAGGYVLLSDDRVCQITNMFDADGVDTDEVDEVEAIVFETPDGRCCAMDPSDVPDPVIH